MSSDTPNIFTFRDIQLATDNFAAENLIIETSTSKVYKVQRLQSEEDEEVELFNVLVHVLKDAFTEENEFSMPEVLVPLKSGHKNIVLVVGICGQMADGEVNITMMVTQDEANGSLDKHLSSKTLTWIQRLQICLGVAHAIRHLHPYVEEEGVIHGNIKSSRILLDDNWVPKLFGFDFSVFLAQSQPLVRISKYGGALQYMDPAFENTRSISHKSDVFSFGVVLFEVLFGQKATIRNGNQWYFADLARHHYENKTLDEKIDSHLRQQMDSQSLHIFSQTAYYCLKEQREQRSNTSQLINNLEKALEHQLRHDNLIHTSSMIMSSDSFEKPEPIEFTFRDIQVATNNFAAENLIVETSNSKVYKVQRLQSEEEEEVELFNVLVHVLKDAFTEKNGLSMTEVFVPLKSENKNIVLFVGICGEMDEDINITVMITQNEANGSLDKHLSSKTLTWIQRLQICLGVAHAIRHLHPDVEEEGVIHGNIKSSRILLDDNWEPKLFGFEFSVLCASSHPLVRINKYGGALQYLDPAFENARSISDKSDVFSFGVVLFEVLFGQKATIQNDNQWYFSDLARHHYEAKTLDEKIDSHLRQQMDSQSLDIFSETAYYCLKTQREQRFNAIQVVKKLEKALEHQLKHENPELALMADKGTLIDNLKGENLDHLRIQLSDIKLSTRNFAETNLIGSGGYGRVYRAELDHYDSRNALYIEEMDRDVWPKRRSIVAIKCIRGTQGKQGFFAEIEMLTKCKHQNIISLLGFCDEDPHMILVYELVSNGSLDDYLGTSSSNYINQTWAQRIHICLDIARGLRYLHSSTKDKPTIIHRDIKSANILLDNNWNAKIADFGLSKLRPMNQIGSTLKTNTIAGTEVYLDPEYNKTGNLKKESDLYSFGIVLFEIMCGRLAYDNFFYANNEKGIPSLARRLKSEGRLKDMVDPNIKQAYGNIFTINRGLNQDSLNTFSRIAYQCVEEAQARRPTMENVISELEKALSYERSIIELSKTQNSYLNLVE
uniref:tyrosine-protein kinase JAK1-like n=1 Tax=Erigeron canadensis TaxID=72917 RepID=UPI001CB92D95|nr:tyrosine-protein kinase JAK1-like [Erigeron canadensis]